MPDPLYETYETMVEATVIGSHQILLALTGSRAYGTGTEASDHDFRGVYQAGLRSALALRTPPQTINLSRPHDAVSYELRHFCKLAAAANPTVLETLWAPTFKATDCGHLLRDNRDLFLSKRILKTYGGYALGQLKKAEKGTGGSRGADHHKRLKFRLHTIRLLDAGVAALRGNGIMVEVPNAATLVRLAEKMSMKELVEHAEMRLKQMHYFAAQSELPDEPDESKIDYLMFRMRMGQC